MECEIYVYCIYCWFPIPLLYFIASTLPLSFDLPLPSFFTLLILHSEIIPLLLILNILPTLQSLLSFPSHTHPSLSFPSSLIHPPLLFPSHLTHRILFLLNLTHPALYIPSHAIHSLPSPPPTYIILSQLVSLLINHHKRHQF